MTKTEVVDVLDMYINELKPAIKQVETLFGGYKRTVEFWRRYARERTHDQQLKDIADNDIKLVEQLEYVAEWLQDHLNNLEKLKKELGK
jgi:hypothetical protein